MKDSSEHGIREEDESMDFLKWLSFLNIAMFVLGLKPSCYFVRLGM